MRLPTPATGWPEIVSRRGRARAWNVYLAVGLAFIGAYYLLPEWIQNIVYQVPGSLVVIAILAGVLVHRPTRRAPWLILAAGLALATTGDWIYTIGTIDGQDIPFPSLADAAYLPGYALMAVGFILMVRGRVPGGDRAGLIDAGIIATGIGVLAWIFLMAPITEDASQSAFQQAIALAYPACDLLLLGVMARLLLAPGPRVPAFRLILLGLCVYVLADFYYAYLSLTGGYQAGQLVDAAYLLVYVCWGAAALHPSMGHIAEPIERGEVHFSGSRLALLAAASLLAPTVMLYQWLTGDPIDVPVIAGASTVLFLLVTLRMGGVVGELSATLRQRRALELELQHRVVHDPLTGLANRVLFRDRLEHALGRRHGGVAVLFLDLDDFKTVNDTAGHAAGDGLIVRVGAAIAASIRTADTAARLGGDEFAILLEDGADEGVASTIADRLLAAVRAPVQLAGREWVVRASIGISVGMCSRASAESLMRDADIAMYVAKSQGKGQAVRFDPDRFGLVVHGLELEADLERAIHRHEFEVHYQPVVALATGQVIAAEALVRWRHPVRGLIAPGEFIALAESTGAIVDLGRWVLERACRDAVQWLHEGHACPISVNVSALQLTQPGMAEMVAKVLGASGLPANRLTLEVTESTLLAEGPAIQALERISALGVHLAIDDFGTGYASLAQLARSSFDQVKIDRSFVEALHPGSRVEAILDGVLTFARRVGVDVVAEGIEDDAQLAALLHLGCEFGQGYLFARPMPGPEFRTRLEGEPAVLPDRRQSIALALGSSTVQPPRSRARNTLKSWSSAAWTPARIDGSSS